MEIGKLRRDFYCEWDENVCVGLHVLFSKVVCKDFEIQAVCYQKCCGVLIWDNYLFCKCRGEIVYEEFNGKKLSI